ncbi:MAG: acyltransferase family protein, partial [Pseudorhodobacter sp.]|nr:acyltransferase family protein [Frankiaceae bacterium]
MLPATLALEHTDCVGRVVPGSTVRIEAGTGEVVVTGPGVMLGYAVAPADLALGRTVEALHTGDLGTIGPDGLLRLVGRRRRTAKVLGLRVDLVHVEAVLSDQGIVACCAESDGVLVVAVDGDGDDRALRRQAAQVAGLPPRAVRAAHLGQLPRLPTGKPDVSRAIALVPAVRPTSLTGGLLALYADVLDRDDLTVEDSFVLAGGDSMSYVELSLRLEDALGHLPPGWHLTAIGDLRPAVTPRRPRLETSVALRALAIVLIVSFHSNALAVVGGAHVLVGVAGVNLARFGLSAAPRRERLRHLRASVVRLAVPTVLWSGAVALVTGSYGLATVLQVNAVFGPREWGPAWQLWFVEALLQLLALVALLVAVPALDRAERRKPFAAAAVLVGLGLLLRAVPQVGGPDGIHTSAAVLWLFALGWAAARATGRWRRLAVSAALLAGLPGFFDDFHRAAVVGVGLLALVWLPELRCPPLLRRLAGVLASSSLWIYLIQWQVYPRFEADWPWLGVLASLAVGIAA